MKQPGFSLIEIIIALAISAVLSLILYRSFIQSNKLMQQVRTLMEDNSDILSSYAQIEKDLSGAFIPLLEKVEKAAPPAAPQQQPGTPQPPTPAAPKKEAEKPEITPFVTTYAEGALASISFVTTTVLTTFDEAVPHLARVTYRFTRQAAESAQPLFTLMREEAPYDQKAELEKKRTEKKPTHAYALIRNISERSVEFNAYACKKDGATELVTLTQWGTDEQKKKAPELLLPEFVELTLAVTDPTTARSTELIVAVTIPAAHCQHCKVAETKAPAQPTNAAEQGKQPPAPAPAAPQPAGKRGIFNNFRNVNKGRP